MYFYKMDKDAKRLLSTFGAIVIKLDKRLLMCNRDYKEFNPRTTANLERCVGRGKDPAKGQ